MADCFVVSEKFCRADKSQNKNISLCEPSSFAIRASRRRKIRQNAEMEHTQVRPRNNILKDSLLMLIPTYLPAVIVLVLLLICRGCYNCSTDFDAGGREPEMCCMELTD